MSGDSASSLQTAIYTKLYNSGVLATAIGATGRVFDFVAQDQEFPFVTIGEDTFKEWGSATFDGMEATITIHSWSQGTSARGRKQVKSIMSAIYGLLHNSSLSISGHIMVSMRFEFSQTLLDPDGVTYHGVQRFRAFTQGV